MGAWQSQVQTTYSTFDTFKFFEDEVTQFSSFYINSLNGSFCDYNCYGIQRLLCCDLSTAWSIGNSCFPRGTNVQTVVVHNDNEYGGAGYVSSNVATTSTHPSAPLVAVHELGHSLFDFYDEYTYISNTPSSAVNCDSSPTCPKWNDMIGTYPNICSGSTGCAGGNYYVSKDNSFMKALNTRVGPVLLRYTCCTFYSLTDSIPPYCDKFLNVGMGLYSYCDASGYAPDPSIALTKASLSSTEDKEGSLVIKKTSISTPGGQLIYVSNPIKVILSVIDIEASLKDQFRSIFVKNNPTQHKLKPGYYHSSILYGENDKAVTSATRNITVKVVIKFDSGEVKKMHVSKFYTVAVPLSESGEPEKAVQMKKDEIDVIFDQDEHGSVQTVEVHRVYA